MNDKEIITIEDRLYKGNSVIFEFVTPEDGMEYNHAVVNESARKFVDVLNDHLSTGFCVALAKCLRDEGY